MTKPQISLHLMLTLTHKEYSRVTSLSNLTSQLRIGSSSPWTTAISTIPSAEESPNPQKSANAKGNTTLLMLVRNSDVEDAIKSIRELEDRFNKKYSYPWVLLNEVPFTPEFIKCVHFLPMPCRNRLNSLITGESVS
jgi:alpha 1,2-mannosyltransferase